MEWLRRIGGVAGTGLMWAVVWAAVGALIGIADAGGFLKRLWLGPAIGLQPGFLAGLLFCALLAVAASRRRLDTLPLPVVLALGSIAGLAVGVLPFAINPPPSGVPLWQVGLVVVGSMAVAGAVSAAGSLALARTTTAGKR